MLLSSFDGQKRLLARALMSGVSGAHRANTVLYKLQRTNQNILCDFIDALSRDELKQPQQEEDGGEPLTVKPLVCLFPALFKQNLLSFLHLVSPALPEDRLLRLLKCLHQDSNPNPWITAMSSQLKRNLRCHYEEPLYSKATSLRLQELSKRLVNPDQTSGWTKCFGGEIKAYKPQSDADTAELGSQRKRKSSGNALDAGGDQMGQQSKRMKLDVSVNQHVVQHKQIMNNKTPERLEIDAVAETAKSDSLRNSLPDHIKASALQIKDLLDSQAEWEQSFTDVFRVLNDCDLQQVEEFCRILCLSDIPEHTLPKVCSSILALSPDLSYSTAAALIRSLLLHKVLLLTKPASRCLVTAVTSVCGRYPRPMCHTLIGPVLEEKNIGPPQAELLNRLIEGCLDSHYRLLVVQMTLKTVWSEAVLSVIHSLLESKPVLDQELFSQFIHQLVTHEIHFTKSVKFAKIVLTVLTKYSSNVTAEHKQSLSKCLMQNETFLKKSLQAALKRIGPT
ncbi:Fanconi anemia group E protein [Gouania willdenowi]|uniref:Fanconi Anaemia group E protein C-terminal domain-containing protein n=1 Tax=Gouania willdenowi TaxID=441366 RepID=A0A8C5H9F3_GOUWI|nr:Fanconi anemia group E protein [Gouania willdenowi]